MNVDGEGVRVSLPGNPLSDPARPGRKDVPVRGAARNLPGRPDAADPGGFRPAQNRTRLTWISPIPRWTAESEASMDFCAMRAIAAGDAIEELSSV